MSDVRQFIWSNELPLSEARGERLSIRLPSSRPLPDHFHVVLWPRCDGTPPTPRRTTVIGAAAVVKPDVRGFRRGSSHTEDDRVDFSDPRDLASIEDVRLSVSILAAEQMRSTRSERVLVPPLLSIALCSCSALADPIYQVTNLGIIPPASTTYANAVNRSGIVAGACVSSSFGAAFRWSGGQISALPGLTSSFGWASGISDAGVIVGQGSRGGFLRPVRWDGDVVTELPWIPGGSGANSGARAVNDSGIIVGYSPYPGGGGDLNVHACRWLGSSVTDLGALAGDTSSATRKLNSAGDAVGFSGSTVVQPRRAVLWPGEGGMVDLGTLGQSAASDARGINDLGQIVGVRGQCHSSLKLRTTPYITPHSPERPS